MRYLLFSLVFFLCLSCTNNNSIQHFETEKNIIFMDTPHTEIIYDSVGKFLENSSQNSLKCNIDIVREIDKNFDKLSAISLRYFLMTFSKDCKNNAEYLEYSNEILFKLLDKYPDVLVQVMNDNKKELDIDCILYSVSHPVNDKIDLLHIKHQLQNLKNPMALKLLESLPFYENN